jgi:hypothetical protein
MSKLVKDLDTELAAQLSIGIIISVAFDRLIEQNKIFDLQNKILIKFCVVFLGICYSRGAI